MNCTKCGAKIAPGEKFCASCGEPAPESTQSASGGFANQAQNTFNQINDTPDFSNQFDPSDIADNKGISVLSYIGIFFLIPMLARPQSRFARFHVNQGIVLLIADVISGIAMGIVGWIPVIGWICSAAVSIAIFVLWIIGIINAVNGKAKELPLIGKIRVLKD